MPPASSLSSSRKRPPLQAISHEHNKRICQESQQKRGRPATGTPLQVPSNQFGAKDERVGQSPFAQAQAELLDISQRPRCPSSRRGHTLHSAQVLPDKGKGRDLSVYGGTYDQLIAHYATFGASASTFNQLANLPDGLAAVLALKTYGSCLIKRCGIPLKQLVTLVDALCGATHPEDFLALLAETSSAALTQLASTAASASYQDSIWSHMVAETELYEAPQDPSSSNSINQLGRYRLVSNDKDGSVICSALGIPPDDYLALGPAARRQKLTSCVSRYAADLVARLGMPTTSLMKILTTRSPSLLLGELTTVLSRHPLTTSTIVGRPPSWGFDDQDARLYLRIHSCLRSFGFFLGPQSTTHEALSLVASASHLRELGVTSEQLCQLHAEASVRAALYPLLVRWLPEIIADTGLDTQDLLNLTDTYGAFTPFHLIVKYFPTLLEMGYAAEDLLALVHLPQIAVGLIHDTINKKLYALTAFSRSVTESSADVADIYHFVCMLRNTQCLAKLDALIIDAEQKGVNLPVYPTTNG